MKHVSPETLLKVNKIVEELFSSMAINFLGQIPQLTRDKRISFSTSQNNLAHMFIQALGNVRPNTIEEEIFKQMISSANSYVDSLKEKTKAQVQNSVSNYYIEQSLRNEEPKAEDLRELIRGHLDKAQTHFNVIANAESKNVTNMGNILKITRIAAEQGVERPIVFYNVLYDDRTAEQPEKNIHLVEGTLIPRLWYIDELSSQYWKKGMKVPSIWGGHVNCFTGDQLLYTNQGLISLKDLYDSQKAPIVAVDGRVTPSLFPANQTGKEISGKPVFSAHRNPTSKFRQASVVYDTGVQEILKITLANGLELKVTENHEMWYQSKSRTYRKIEASNLKIGDCLPISSQTECFGTDSFKDEAELMGNLMGDGTFNSKNFCAVWNFFGDDIPYGNKLLEIRNRFEHKNDTQKKLEILNVKPANSKYTVPHSQFASRYLGEKFYREFGFSKKPRRVPQRLFQANKATVSAFLRGLYAADGHSEKNAIIIAQNDREFLKQIQILLNMFGINAKIYKHGENMKKVITYANGDKFDTNRKECWRLHFAGYRQVKYFLENIGFGVPRKQQKAWDNLTYAVKETYRTSRVVKIERIGAEQTYCLTEPMTNTVSVNGIVTGQCRCKITYLAKGYGFDDTGKIVFKGLEHDEITEQRKKYGMP